MEELSLSVRKTGLYTIISQISVSILDLFICLRLRHLLRLHHRLVLLLTSRVFGNRSGVRRGTGGWRQSRTHASPSGPSRCPEGKGTGGGTMAGGGVNKTKEIPI